jgi:ribonuclease HI
MNYDITLYTDGSCVKPNGKGGWAYLIRYTETGCEVQGSGHSPSTTCNRMELQAAIEGLKVLPQQCGRVLLISDSTYLVKGLTHRLSKWKRNGYIDRAPNSDLWKDLDRLAAVQEFSAEHVYGHTGNPGNEWCDKEARRQSGVTSSPPRKRRGKCKASLMKPGRRQVTVLAFHDGRWMPWDEREAILKRSGNSP